MAKVTGVRSEEAPSEQIIKKANERVTVTDARGRSIVVRRMTVLDRMRMSRLAGPGNSMNEPYMLYVLVACSVVSIDDIDVIAPSTERQLEAAISHLGDDGYDAARDAVLDMYGAKDAEEIVTTAKKS